MAVTKIRKISSTILLILLAISVVVCGVFFLGGKTVEPETGNTNYHQTGLLLFLMYGLGLLTLLITIVFSLISFAKGFKTNRKRAITNLTMILALVTILVITYVIGDGTPLVGVHEDSLEFNTPGWLKTIDMCLYSIYALFGITIIALVAGAIRKAFVK